LDPADLAADRRPVGAAMTVALPLEPEPAVLLPQVRERRRHPALEAEAVPDLAARHLAAAAPAEDDQGHQERSATIPPDSSLSRSGWIGKTASGRPAAAHTTSWARRSRST